MTERRSLADPGSSGSGAAERDPAGQSRRRRGWLATLVVALTVINIGLIWALAFYGRDEWRAMQLADDDRAMAGDDDDDHVASASRADRDHGEPVVWVPEAAQQASGIVTAPLAAAAAGSERLAWATVLDSQPLIEARARHDGAAAALRAAEAAINRATGELRRLRALYADDRNVSASAVEAAQSQLRAEEARLAQARSTRAAALEGVRAQWGDAIADAFGEPGDDLLVARLLRRERVLVQVTVPGEGRASVVPPAEIRIDGEPARYVGPAVRGDPQFAGPTFLFSAAAGSLRAGTRLAVRLPGDGDPENAVVVPHEAAVWHGGKAWAYVASGQGERGTRFARRRVETRAEVASGWINRDRFAVGDAVVIDGAQLLLSEELRYQVQTDD